MSKKLQSHNEDGLLLHEFLWLHGEVIAEWMRQRAAELGGTEHHIVSIDDYDGPSSYYKGGYSIPTQLVGTGEVETRAYQAPALARALYLSGASYGKLTKHRRRFAIETEPTRWFANEMGAIHSNLKRMRSPPPPPARV